MSDFTAETTASSFENKFNELAQLLTFPFPNWEKDAGSTKTESLNPEDEDKDPEANTIGDDSIQDPSRALLDAFEEWSTNFSKLLRDSDSINIHFLSRIWSRFYFTLIGIGNTVPRKDQFLGWLLHRQIIALLSAVLIEEMNDTSTLNENERVKPFYDNPSGQDRSFITNLKRVFDTGHKSFLDDIFNTIQTINQAENERGIVENTETASSPNPRVISIEDLDKVTTECGKRYPLFFALFSCPLWACYLYPEVPMQEKPKGKIPRNNIPSTNSDSIVFTLLDLQILHWAKWLPEPSDGNTRDVRVLLSKAKAVLKVDYTFAAKDTCSFTNLYHLLSSIPVAAGASKARVQDKEQEPITPTPNPPTKPNSTTEDASSS